MSLITDHSLAETYVNACYCGHPCPRWWAHPNILIGGSINDAEDFAHIVKDFGVTHVISVESEHTDEGKVPAPLRTYLPVPDDGSPPPAAHWRALVTIAKLELLLPGGVLYVHCQMGGSRSPAAAYAIMRGAFGMSQEASLAQLRTGKPTYGDHAYHQSYLESFEKAFVESWGTV